MIDVGAGPPLVLVPGIQGRWEWMRPTVRALAARFRVLTASLPGEPGSGSRGRRAAETFDAHVRHVADLMDRAGVERAVVLGVSFGGLVAGRVAAARPERTQALVLASTPGPRWEPDRRVRHYIRTPRLMAPVFVGGAPWRLGPEIVAAHDTVARRIGFAAAQAGRVLRSPMRPALTAARLRLMAAERADAWWDRVEAPTLVITGEPGLDRVVSVEDSRAYSEVIRGARLATLPRTGHIGCVTRADAFAGMVWGFY